MECKIKNLSINYEIIGEGKPIVMIHGYYPDHRLMMGINEYILTCQVWGNQKVQNGLIILILCLIF